LRNLGLFSNRIIRVFDELILRPSEEIEFKGGTLLKEVKEVSKKVKTLPKDLDTDKDTISDSPEKEE
jgi:hypothetical protein